MNMTEYTNTKEYRNFICFTQLESEYQKFIKKIDKYYNWCIALGLNPEDDENYNSYCESQAS